LQNLFAQSKLTTSVKSLGLPEVNLPNKHHFQSSVPVSGLFNLFPQFNKKIMKKYSSKELAFVVKPSWLAESTCFWSIKRRATSVS
jgi:hypothetical protein